jgi:hypothetical protein
MFNMAMKFHNSGIDAAFGAKTAGTARQWPSLELDNLQ